MGLQYNHGNTGQGRSPGLSVPGEIEEVRADDRGDGRIEGLMARAGVTQTELGEYLGCTQQFLSKVATGKRRWPQGMRKGGGVT